MKRLIAELQSERFTNKLLFHLLVENKKATKCIARVSYNNKVLEDNCDFLVLFDSVLSNYEEIKHLYNLSCRRIKRIKRRINNEQKNISYKKNELLQNNEINK